MTSRLVEEGDGSFGYTRKVSTPTGTVQFYPYISRDGTVGIRIWNLETGQGEYIYFNVPEVGPEAGPDGPGVNVFLYKGKTGDPAQDVDGVQHFYYLLEEEN